METRANKRKLSAKTSECIPDVATTRLGGVFAEPRGVETAGTSHTATRVQDYIEVPIVAIKTEYEDEEAIPMQKSGWECTHQWQNPINDIVKQENDFAVEPEQGKFYEVTIKRELDIGPTTLRPETASCALLPPNEIGTCSGPLQLMLPKEEPDLSNKNISIRMHRGVVFRRGRSPCARRRRRTGTEGQMRVLKQHDVVFQVTDYLGILVL